MWKAGVHWLMTEGVECMVELVDGSKGVVVIAKSINDRAQSCVGIFSKVISCVTEAKAEFCHTIRPHFFLFDPTTYSGAGSLSSDNLFAMSEVEKALTHPEGNDVILSVSGRAQMERSKLLCMRPFTNWNILFPLEFHTILDLLKDIVKDLYQLGLCLGISRGTLDAIEADFPTDTGRRRRELVRKWLSSSLDPPCWWHLVQAFQRIDERVLAEKIRTGRCKLSFELYIWMSNYFGLFLF
jgi:hypothetical protein